MYDLWPWTGLLSTDFVQLYEQKATSSRQCVQSRFKQAQNLLLTYCYAPLDKNNSGNYDSVVTVPKKKMAGFKHQLWKLELFCTRATILMKTAHGKVCGLSWLLGALFLDRCAAVFSGQKRLRRNMQKCFRKLAPEIEMICTAGHQCIGMNWKNLHWWCILLPCHTWSLHHPEPKVWMM